jgi:hypothetical protein
VAGIRDIHELLGQNTRQGLYPDLPIKTSHGGWSAIQVDNRYFTSARIVPNEQPVAIDTEIDPSGALRSMMGGGWIHLEENRVRYFERKVKATGPT